MRRIRNFFIRFEANLSEYGYYSLHIRMFRYIDKSHLFASFASYSLQIIRTDSHTYIRFDAKNTCCSRYSLQGKYSLRIAPNLFEKSLTSFRRQLILVFFNIRLERNIRFHFYSFRMQNSPMRFVAKQAKKTCFIRFEANKYSIHIR